MLKALKNATASSLNFLSQSAVRLSSTFWTGLVYHGCEPLTAGAQSNQVSLKRGHLRWRLIWQLARGPWFRPVTSPTNATCVFRFPRGGVTWWKWGVTAPVLQRRKLRGVRVVRSRGTVAAPFRSSSEPAAQGSLTSPQWDLADS